MGGCAKIVFGWLVKTTGSAAGLDCRVRFREVAHHFRPFHRGSRESSLEALFRAS